MKKMQCTGRGDSDACSWAAGCYGWHWGLQWLPGAAKAYCRGVSRGLPAPPAGQAEGVEAHPESPQGPQ